MLRKRRGFLRVKFQWCPTGYEGGSELAGRRKELSSGNPEAWLYGDVIKQGGG